MRLKRRAVNLTSAVSQQLSWASVTEDKLIDDDVGDGFSEDIRNSCQFHPATESVYDHNNVAIAEESRRQRAKDVNSDHLKGVSFAELLQMSCFLGLMLFSHLTGVARLDECLYIRAQSFSSSSVDEYEIAFFDARGGRLKGSNA